MWTEMFLVLIKKSDLKKPLKIETLNLYFKKKDLFFNRMFFVFFHTHCNEKGRSFQTFPNKHQNDTGCSSKHDSIHPILRIHLCQNQGS